MKSTTRSPGAMLERAIEVPAVIVIFLMMLHVTANALLRTAFDRPIQHTLEFVQYWYLPIIALLGFVAAQQRGQHIAADLVYAKLPKVTQRFVLSAVYAISAVVSFAFAWYGWPEATNALELRKTAGVSTVPAWPVFFLVPLVFGGMTVQLAIASVRALTHPEDGPVITDREDAMVLEQLAIDAKESR